MQNVAMTLNHLTGSGWKDTQLTFSCDENIGLNAGRDIFSTARGSAITLAKKFMIHESTNVRIVVDEKVFIDMTVHNGKFEKSPAKEVGTGRVLA